MTIELFDPEIRPLSTQGKMLMIMLHGVGADGADLISLVPFIQPRLPDYHFVSLNGLENCDMTPFGRQWFSLSNRTPSVLYSKITANAPSIQNMIQEYQKKLGFTNQQTVLFGFSQGAMVTAYLTLIQNVPFAAAICCSGGLLPPIRLINQDTPICIIHGTEDQVIPAEESKKFAHYCTINSIPHALKLIPNLTHSIDSTGLDYAVNFLLSRLTLTEENPK